MGLRINLNAAAMGAHRSLANSDTALGKTIERLSSGFKINNAGDDPAGLVISEKLRAQISGLGQAVKNAGDAVNMVKTAEGALNEVQRLLRSMRDLAVHAANTGATDAVAVAADQAQIVSALQSIDKIAVETKFGNKSLLDGSAGITATPIGSGVTSGNFGSGGTTGITGNTIVSVTVTQAATKASMTSTVNIVGTPIVVGKLITINGVQIASGAGNAATIQNINDQTGLTGVVASMSGNFLKLDQVSYGSTNRIDVTGADATIWNSTSAAAIGVDAAATVTATGGANVSDASWTSGSGTLLKDSNGNTISLTATAAAAGGGVPSALGAQLNVLVGTLTFQMGAFAGQTRSLSIASMMSDQLGTAAITGESAATVDVTSSTGAQNGILILDAAISDLSGLRAALGATQKNVLESSITSLTIAKENIAASESSIRDTDMAEEVVNLTKYQILQQSGVSMLAQANQLPQTLLKLLQ